MPKLKESPQAQTKREIFSTVEYKKRYYDLMDKDVAAMIGLPTPTYSRRKTAPEHFSLTELQRLFSKLHFTDEEILRCVKPK